MLTITDGSTTITATSDAYADATVTYCGRFTLIDDRLLDGAWNASVAYRSASAAGTSNTVEVQVY